MATDTDTEMGIEMNRETDNLWLLEVDCRESALLHEWSQLPRNRKQCSVRTEVKSLPVADLILHWKGQAVLWIERKTVPDLLASAVDGRYHEQGQRLSLMPSVVYIIEGEEPTGEEERRKCRGLIQSILFSKGFAYVSTQSVKDTAEWVWSLIQKWHRNIEKEGRYPKTWQKKEGCQPSYESTLCTVKKHNVQRSNIGQIMLTQVPGISDSLAKHLLHQCGTTTTTTKEEKEEGNEEEKEEGNEKEKEGGGCELVTFLQMVQTNPRCMDTWTQPNGRKLSKSVIQSLIALFGTPDETKRDETNLGKKQPKKTAGDARPPNNANKGGGKKRKVVDPSFSFPHSCILLPPSAFPFQRKAKDDPPKENENKKEFKI